MSGGRVQSAPIPDGGGKSGSLLGCSTADDGGSMIPEGSDEPLLDLYL